MEPPTSDSAAQNDSNAKPYEGLPARADSCKPSQGLVLAFLAIIVFGLTLTAGLFYWKFDWRVTAFFLGSGIPHKAPWLPAIGEFGRPLTPFWLLLLWAWAAKRPRVLLAGLLAMLLTLCTVLPIKSVVGRIRPDQDPAEVMQQPFWERSYSFPSGDATLAFAVATAAAGFIAVAKVRWLPFLLAAMAGMTRLMMLRHFASDVIAGAALGILCGYAALRISRCGFSRRMLSRVPPTCWRPAFGIAALLYLIFDTVTGGPVTKNFLPVFWPAVAFALIAAKGPAWLTLMYWRRSVWTPYGGMVWFFSGLLMTASALLFAAACLVALPQKWIWFLLAAAVAMIGFCWARPWRAGLPGRAAGRLAAASVLSIGLSLQAIKLTAYLLGR